MARTARHPEWKTTLKERLSYCMGFSASVGESVLLQVWLTTYLLMTGLDVGVTAVILLIIKTIDAVDDMLFGWIVDRFNPADSRILRKYVGTGRFIPWLRLCFAVMPVAVVLLYHIPAGAPDWVKIAWFCAAYLMADLGYTILDVPMNALLTTMTSDGGERDSIIMLRSYMMMAIDGAVYLGVTVLISEHIGMSIGSAITLFSVMMTVCMLPMVFNVKERAIMEVHAAEGEEKITFTESVRCLLRNRNLLSYHGGSLVSGCLATGSAVSLFASYYLFGDSLFSLVLSVPALVFTAIMTAFIPKLAEKYDKNRIRMVCLSIGLVTGLLVYFVGYRNVPLYLAVFVLNLIPTGIAGAISSYLVPNCIEYGKYKTGKDATGISYALGTFTAKFPSAIASSLGLWLLGLYGWVSIEAESFAEIAALGVTQSASALHGLWAITSGYPLIGSLLAFICYLFYNLTDKDAAVMAKCNAGEITREEAEKLLSRKY